jgi:hypothetical protein
VERASLHLFCPSNFCFQFSHADNQVWLPHFDVALPRSGNIGMTQNPVDEKIIIRHQFVQVARKAAPKNVPSAPYDQPFPPSVFVILLPTITAMMSLFGFTALLTGIENRVNPIIVKIVQSDRSSIGC